MVRRQASAGFWWLYSAEMLSVTATGLSAFALGAWVFSQTHKATDFALLSTIAILPGVALLPIGGVLADRLPRRAVMLACNALAGLSVLVMIAAMQGQVLGLGLLYGLLALLALCRALQWVTFTAAMTQLVPAQQLGRMSGLIYLGEAGQRLLAPAVGALCLPWIGVAGLLGVEVAISAYACAVIWMVRVPSSSPDAAPQGFGRSVRQGWRFIRDRPGLWGLQVFFALSQFLGGFLPVLTLPALMGMTGSERVTGLTMAFSGLGLVLGAGVLGLWPVRGRRVKLTLLCDAASSLSLLILALGSPRFGSMWVGLWGFIFLFCHALESGISQELWQRKVPVGLQGRVFAIRRTISWSLVPLCYVLAGPLVDGLLTPRFVEGGAWWVGLFGAGQVGAILALMALSALLRLGVLVPWTWRDVQVRELDERLPDAL